MARQLVIAVLLLLGLGIIHAAGTHRPLKPKPFDDPYAWLGPLPGPGAEVRERWDRLAERMATDAASVDVRRFVCRSPEEVGALPMMGNVMRYVHHLPASQDDKGLAEGLSAAAARGNWVARTLLLPVLLESEEVRLHYRAVQLAEWLHAQKLGPLYSELEDLGIEFGLYDKGQGNDPTGFIAAAAMRQDYAAQASIGSALVTSDDPQLIGAGGRMLVCAASARAYYRKVADDLDDVPGFHAAVHDATRAQQ